MCAPRGSDGGCETGLQTLMPGRAERRSASGQRRDRNSRTRMSKTRGAIGYRICPVSAYLISHICDRVCLLKYKSKAPLTGSWDPSRTTCSLHSPRLTSHEVLTSHIQHSPRPLIDLLCVGDGRPPTRRRAESLPTGQELHERHSLVDLRDVERILA